MMSVKKVRLEPWLAVLNPLTLKEGGGGGGGVNITQLIELLFCVSKFSKSDFISAI